MLNLFSKTTPWMVASLLAATVAIAAQDTTNKDNRGRPQKSYEQGHEVNKNQLMPAYSAPASYDVRGSWDIYATASFLYWQAREDNLELGVVSNGSPRNVPFIGFQNPYVPVNPIPGQYNNRSSRAYVANADFDWGPGFKVGLGMDLDYDNWDVYAEYTWFHKTSSSGFCVRAKCGEQLESWIFPNRSMPVGLTSRYDSEKAYECVSQKWRLKMDFVDVSLARSYYSGTRLTFRPFFGARGAWIRQKLKTRYTNQITTELNDEGAVIIGLDPTLLQIQGGKSLSWGIGPRTGFESNWLVGCGFRLIGNASADVLYTRFDSLSRACVRTRFVDLDFDPDLVEIDFATARLTQKHLDMLRPHVDLEMGFGWGSYFDNSNWHVDLFATYGYQVFWNHNMFRNFSDSWNRSTIGGNGNLYVHGATFTARVDF